MLRTHRSVVMERLLSKKAVREIVGISPAEIDRRENDGKFPRRIRDGGRVFWAASEIEEYVLSKIAARNANTAPKR